MLLEIAQIVIEFLKGNGIGIHQFGSLAAPAEILPGHESPARCFEQHVVAIRLRQASVMALPHAAIFGPLAVR
jgi:hypothetical protein